ncbi:MAG TPA: ATPase domain-containing protein [Candidatus Eisenbacteria bacterium]|nr:ATPase domain-containing protein [Candidatus Eisenbacteria bacterium]
MERLSSGHGRLDEILHGGLPANAVNLVMGAPGSGKTILSQQYVFHNATPERPALYLSTVSEPFDKIVRYAQTLTFFEGDAVGRRVIYEDLGAALRTEGLPGVLATFDTLMHEHRPGLVVIDSFRALHPFAADEGEFRRFLHDVAGRLTAVAASAFWVGEYGDEQVQEAAEFAVADAIIALSVKRVGDSETRVLRVLKLRGSGFASGQHSYRITQSGLDVFPRLADPLDASPYETDTRRVSTGVPALDDLLGDGYWAGAATLVCGPSGVGKTLMGLHFVYKGAEQGEPGIVATLQENGTQLARIVEGFGWRLDAQHVHVMSRTPVDVHIDEWVYELVDLAERVGARRVLIDSLADLSIAAGNGQRFREWLYSLTHCLSRRGVSLMMTLEVPELFEIVRISEHGMSHLSDNVLLLQYVRENGTLRRALTVLKTRASSHDARIRLFEITPGGIMLADDRDRGPG